MTTKQPDTFSLQQEWEALHKSDERAEALSLVIKLLAVVILLAGWALALNSLLMTALLAVCWLQEGIWKTFQSRTQQRLIDLEQAIGGEGDAAAFQFYHDWQHKRPGTVALIGQYIGQSLRPTVAYPYAVLIVLALLEPWVG